MFNIFDYFFGFNKTQNHYDGSPTASKVKKFENSDKKNDNSEHESEVRLVSSADILAEIAKYLDSPRDVVNLFEAFQLHLYSLSGVYNDALKFRFKESELYCGQPVSIPKAKKIFESKAKLQYRKIQAVLDKEWNIWELLFRINKDIGVPPSASISHNIKTFRAVEDWMYEANLVIIKREINKAASLGDTRLDLANRGLSYFPLAVLLEDEEIRNYLSRITSLDLSHNKFSGAIPAGLEKLHTLAWLILDNNQFSGVIPPELAQLNNLEWLNLNNNQLSGSIPPELGQLDNLQWLNLNHNRLSGIIPLELGQLHNLDWLRLNHNQLNGIIPAELGQLNNLKWLNLNHNQLSGIIPDELGQLNNLQWLNLSHNQFSGIITTELERLINLRKLTLNHNQFSGVFPPELGQLTNLDELSLNNNQLSGAIPWRLRHFNPSSFAGQSFVVDEHDSEVVSSKKNRM